MQQYGREIIGNGAIWDEPTIFFRRESVLSRSHFEVGAMLQRGITGMVSYKDMSLLLKE